MNDNRLTRQTYKTLLGSTAVDSSIRNALGDIGNRIGLSNVQFGALNNKKQETNQFVKPGVPTAAAAATGKPTDEYLGSLMSKNVKLTKTTTTTTTSVTQSQVMTNTKVTLATNQVNEQKKETTTSNNSCIMLDEDEIDEVEDVELEEMDEDDEEEEEEDEEEEEEDEDEEEDEEGDEEDASEKVDEKTTTKTRGDKQKVVDIDHLDSENTQLVSEYVKDIYKYLGQMERKFRISPSFLEHKIVTSKMRSVLIDWLIQVHLKFHLLQETLYLCVQIIDAYLQAQDVTKMQLQLVGVTAMFLASKYEEMYVPAIDDFVYMTDNTYTKSEIRQMEISILKTLGFMFGKPLPLHFLRRFSKAGSADPKQHTLAKYFMELSLHDSEFSSLDPSYLAACSLCLSFKLLDGPEWNNVMEYYSTYKLAVLWPGMQKIAKLALKAMDLDYKYRAATNKYGASKFMRISLIPELTSNFMKELAAGQIPA